MWYGAHEPDIVLLTFILLQKIWRKYTTSFISITSYNKLSNCCFFPYSPKKNKKKLLFLSNWHTVVPSKGGFLLFPSILYLTFTVHQTIHSIDMLVVWRSKKLLRLVVHLVEYKSITFRDLKCDDTSLQKKKKKMEGPFSGFLLASSEPDKTQQRKQA